MTILYSIKDNLYINITNKCPCACTFCERQLRDGVDGENSLWLKREPTVEEIIGEFKKTDLSKYNEIVFCGFGEPTERLDVICEVAKFIRTITDQKIRLNTNGLSDLIHGRPTACELEGLIDGVSISLNASTAEEYLKVTRSKFGIGSYNALLKFASDAKKYVPEVVLSVVDIIGAQEVEKCRKICEEIGVTYRVRPYEA